jgi:hypothetical protein
MANKKDMVDPISTDDMEALQFRIAQAQLRTAEINLVKAERENALWEQNEEARHKANEERQGILANLRRIYYSTVKSCRHKSGGRPTNILKGGGIGSFSIISRALMPDGVTWFLQCPRCRMKEYSPSLALKASNPKEYEKAQERFEELWEASMDSGLEHMRGPTFQYTNEHGVPFIPELK